MKLSMVGVFISWKLANTTRQGLFNFYFILFFCGKRASSPAHDCSILQKALPLYQQDGCWQQMADIPPSLQPKWEASTSSPEIPADVPGLGLTGLAWTTGPFME